MILLDESSPFLAQRVSGSFFVEKKCKMKKDKETPKWEKGPALKSLISLLCGFLKFSAFKKCNFEAKKQKIILPISLVELQSY